MHPSEPFLHMQVIPGIQCKVVLLLSIYTYLLNTQQLNVYIHFSCDSMSHNYRFINGFYVQGEMKQIIKIYCIFKIYCIPIWDFNSCELSLKRIPYNLNDD